ncbi:MAG: hypothetical protein ACHQFW_09055 [Chitinophagales bacterium]
MHSMYSGYTNIIYFFILMIVPETLPAQNNSVNIYIGPGISSTTSSSQSNFDPQYFHAWSPYVNFTAEIIYQHNLNERTLLATGLGYAVNEYQFVHDNYAPEFEGEYMIQRIVGPNFKVPLLFKFQINDFEEKGTLMFTGGMEINFLNARGNKTGAYGSGSFNTDSTMMASFDGMSLNASVRVGAEMVELFHNKKLGFFTNVIYQLRPYGEITIINNSTNLPEPFVGTLIPKQVGLYFGLSYEI